jgi:hypothetical protein
LGEVDCIHQRVFPVTDVAIPGIFIISHYLSLSLIAHVEMKWELGQGVDTWGEQECGDRPIARSGEPVFCRRSPGLLC